MVLTRALLEKHVAARDASAVAPVHGHGEATATKTPQTNGEYDVACRGNIEKLL